MRRNYSLSYGCMVWIVATLGRCDIATRREMKTGSENGGATHDNVPWERRGREKSLSSERTLQLIHRAAATEKLKTVSLLYSFKKEKANSSSSSSRTTHATIPAASREQAIRLYNGPTVRLAGAWDALYDSPGPQAYDEGEKWREKFRNVPSARIAVAKCERDMVPPKAPGPGDYNVAHSAIGDKGNAMKFGDPARRCRYPPRTPDQPLGEVPCSYAEHVSCLDHQVTSGRQTSPAFCFGGAPRFQAPLGKHGDGAERTTPTKKENRSKPEATSRGRRGVSTPNPCVGRVRRGKKRRKRRAGPRVFRREDYGWLVDCIEPKPWEPTLKLLDSRPSTTDPSRSLVVTRRGAPRPVLRRGLRHNPSQYNPQRRDLPRETDVNPGPKYNTPLQAFGRTGGRGSVVAPSAFVSFNDRFPRGRLFEEEEMREREATPGPEAYDVVLDHRLEGAALEEMQGSLQTLASWGILGVRPTSEWQFAEHDAAEEHSDTEEGLDAGERAEVGRPCSAATGKEQSSGMSRTEKLDELSEKTRFGRRRAPCSAGRSVQCLPPSVAGESILECGKCSRLSLASSVAAGRRIRCQECLEFELGNAANTFIAAASSLSDPNLSRRAQTTGASVRFGDMPRQRSAPAFTIGSGSRDVSARLLHIPAESIYKEARLGRSGLGPSTASSRAGDILTRPRPFAARVLLPLMPIEGEPSAKKGKACTSVAGAVGSDAGAGPASAGVEVTEGWVVDGALGVQVKSGRPTGPSITLAGKHRSAPLFQYRHCR